MKVKIRVFRLDFEDYCFVFQVPILLGKGVFY